MKWSLKLWSRKRSPRSNVGRLFPALARAVILSTAIFLSQSAFGAELEVQAEADKAQVAQGEPLNFRVTLIGALKEQPEVEVSPFDGFAVAGTRQLQQISVQKGKTVQTLSLFYVLVGQKTGTYTLGPVKVRYQGQVYESKPVTVKVVPGSPGKKQQQEGPPPVGRPRLEGGVIL